MYGSETMIWKEEERSRIRAIHMDNLTGLLGIRRMNKIPNAQIRDLSGMQKGVEESIEGIFRWFFHVERMENDRISKSVDVVEGTGSRSVGGLR